MNSVGVVVPEAQVAGTEFERRPFPPQNRHIASTDVVKRRCNGCSQPKLDAKLLDVFGVSPVFGQKEREQC